MKHEKPAIPPGPVRKIGMGVNSLRGQVQSKKDNSAHNFESSLERDFLLLLEFDYNVQEYTEQPVEIEYKLDGTIRHYTPDVLVKYRTDITPAKNFIPNLVEVKYRSDIKKNWVELKPKFRAAIDYSKKNKWNFKILTEKEIRTPYLENVKFLLSYRDSESIDSNDVAVLTERFKKKKFSTPEKLINEVSNDKYRQAELLYCLWYMISKFYFGCDLSKPLTMNSEIWVR